MFPIEWDIHSARSLWNDGRKKLKTIGQFFPFVSTWTDMATGYDEESPLTKVETVYSDIGNVIMSNNVTAGLSDLELEKLEKIIDNLKVLMKERFESTAFDSLFTLKYHLLDHLEKYLKHFQAINMLNAATFELFNLSIKWLIRQHQNGQLLVLMKIFLE